MPKKRNAEKTWTAADTQGAGYTTLCHILAGHTDVGNEDVLEAVLKENIHPRRVHLFVQFYRMFSEWINKTELGQDPRSLYREKREEGRKEYDHRY